MLAFVVAVVGFAVVVVVIVVVVVVELLVVGEDLSVFDYLNESMTEPKRFISFKIIKLPSF